MKIPKFQKSTAGLLGTAAMAVAFAVSPLQGAAQEIGPVAAPEVDTARAELGKRLFFDVRLSGDAAISCASCHKPELGFTDGMALSTAYPGSNGFRNTPTLINTAQRENWFHDGRIGTNLNDVTRESLTEDYVMNMDMRLMQERVKQDPVYVAMFEAAGMGEPSNGGIRNAIPEYLKTLTSRNAPFDTGEMNDAAQRGFELFTGKAACIQCHSGPLLTDDARHNTGVPDNPDIWGRPGAARNLCGIRQFHGHREFHEHPPRCGRLYLGSQGRWQHGRHLYHTDTARAEIHRALHAQRHHGFTVSKWWPSIMKAAVTTLIRMPRCSRWACPSESRRTSSPSLRHSPAIR